LLRNVALSGRFEPNEFNFYTLLIISQNSSILLNIYQSMKYLFTSISLLFLSIFSLQAQQRSTFEAAYSILQAKCGTCHNSPSHTSGLDLVGTGATTAEKAASVLKNLVNITPKNAAASAKGHKLVYAGRPDLSFLFRKINGDLEPTIAALGTGEGSAMPKSDPSKISNFEKEMIRQWILFGAQEKGTFVKEQTVQDFYDGKGKSAYTTPPPAPAASEGFQIKMGPFFIDPDGELEYFQKWETFTNADLEVPRIDFLMSSYSHHLIMYNYNAPENANTVATGLRKAAYHKDVSMVAAVQNQRNLQLPEGTAFYWHKNIVLDLNSHYINYSATQPYRAESYYNVYTQPSGKAKQQMYSFLVPNTAISIKNDSKLVTFKQDVFNPAAPIKDIYVWALAGHTHKYGKDYKVYLKNADGSKGELMYDASCPNGLPGCSSPTFDYQHIPVRYFTPLRVTDIKQGIIHEASWLNNGDKSVIFGPTSDDEMMVMVLMFTRSPIATTTPTSDVKEMEGVTVFPNPAQEVVYLRNLPAESAVKFTMYDVLGRTVLQKRGFHIYELAIERGDLQNGLYMYRLEDDAGRVKTGKLLFK
jgi:Secretion system C-terminal sorting domain